MERMRGSQDASHAFVVPGESGTGVARNPAPSRTIPILMYHQVDPRPAATFQKYVVAPRAFGLQMRWLSVAGYSPITLDALHESRTGQAPLPARPVVITFDDGFQGCVDHAVPILRQLGFPAVFYLVAGLVGDRSRWLPAERGVEFPLFGWTAARELAAEGFTLGAHSLTHPRLASLRPEHSRAELVESKAILEDRLGLAVDHLAYPYGSYDERVREQAMETGYRTACSVRIGLSDPTDDLHALHRVPILGTESLVSFATRVATAMNAGQCLATLRSRIRRRVMRP
jgi:peptidoglycan/xylan/chitin deacetylase (PgdA/CDA1 family)